MPILSGLQLDTMKKYLVEWYLDTRDKLIHALEEGYPYGSEPLTPSEQLERFLALTPEDWQTITAKVADRYRGRPNVEELVAGDVKQYITRMARLMYRRS